MEIQSAETVPSGVSLIGKRDNLEEQMAFERNTLPSLRFPKKRLTEDLNSAGGVNTNDTGCRGEVLNLREKQSILAKCESEKSSKLGTRAMSNKKKNQAGNE
jgi:hypothetical protein